MRSDAFMTGIREDELSPHHHGSPHGKLEEEEDAEQYARGKLMPILPIWETLSHDLSTPLTTRSSYEKLTGSRGVSKCATNNPQLSDHRMHTVLSDAPVSLSGLW